MNGMQRSCQIFFMTGKLFTTTKIHRDKLAFILNENTTNDEKKIPLNVFSTDELFDC